MRSSPQSRLKSSKSPGPTGSRRRRGASAANGDGMVGMEEEEMVDCGGVLRGPGVGSHRSVGIAGEIHGL